MSPGAFDAVTLAVGVVGYLLGRSRGLLWQASGLATLVGGGLCATILSRPVGQAFGDGVGARFVAWLIVYAAVAICLYVLTLKFKHRIKELEYDELDRRFGGLVGVIKALAVFALLTIVATALAPRLATPVKASVSGQALRALVHELRPLLPEKVHEAFGPWLDAVDQPPRPAPAPTRWPQAEPLPAVPAPPMPPAPRSPAPPPTPAPTTEAPPTDRSTERTPELGDDGTLPPPPRRAPPPAVPPAPDPFDTSRDPVDPLAPPR